MSEQTFEGYLAEQGLPEPGVIGEPQEPETPVAPAVAPETPAEPETPTEPAEPETPLILGKYKTADDLADAYKNLEREKGRLAQEVGELRQQAQPQVPQAPVDPSTVEEVFANNPAAARQAAQSAATKALEQGDTGAYEQIIETWGQYDQFGALRFESARQTLVAQQALAQQIAPGIQSAQAYADQNASNLAAQAIQAKHPDFTEVVGDLADEANAQKLIEDGFPVHLLQLATGSQADRETLLETVYRWRKPDHAETASRASAEVAAQTKEENRQAKQQSAVASASSQVASEATGEDKELEDFYNFLKAPSPTSWADIRPTGQ